MSGSMSVELHVKEGPARGRTFTFGEPDCFLFGRATDAHISLPFDKYLSRHHFLLMVAPPRCKVADLNSTNGIHVNGVRYGGRAPLAESTPQAPPGVREVYLKDGDRIKVGRTVMKVRIQAEGGISPCAPEAAGPARGKGAGADREGGIARSPKGTLVNVTAGPVQKVPGAPHIENFRIEAEIGRGGSGVVYRAKDLRHNRKVAIKTLLPQAATDHTRMQGFLREIEITRQLRHPNIVQLLEYGKTEDGFYVALEYLDGMDLDQFVEFHGGPLPLAQAAPIMLQVLDGLAHAHGARIKTRTADGRIEEFTGIVHRDIKPQNVLLTRSGVGWLAKISDFGLAKSFEAAGMTDMTMPGQVCGSPIYWPREQFTHYRHLDPVTDVFSCAAVFYEVLTGEWVRLGFKEMFRDCERAGSAPGVADFMRVISEQPVVPIRKRDSSVPAPVAAVLDRALTEMEASQDFRETRDKLAQARFPNAGAFKQALVKALLESGVDSTASH